MYNSQSLSRVVAVVANDAFYNFNKSFEIDSTYYLNDSVAISGITSILLRGLICLFFNLFFKLTAAPFHL
jgi:NADH:ubiquinone oxidoreductase subunit 2 (subunit N)